MKKKGMKFDGTDGGEVKPRWDLLPFGALTDVVRVLTFGAKKYDDDNWKHVELYQERYFAATMRHLVAWKTGEILDKETNLPHVAHAICCLLFILWKEQ